MSMSTTTETLLPAYRVRCVFVDSKRPWFLSGSGQPTRLKIRTAYFDKEKAERLAKEITEQNPGVKASADRYKPADGFFTALTKSNEAHQKALLEVGQPI